MVNGIVEGVVVEDDVRYRHRIHLNLRVHERRADVDDVVDDDQVDVGVGERSLQVERLTHSRDRFAIRRADKGCSLLGNQTSGISIQNYSPHVELQCWKFPNGRVDLLQHKIGSRSAFDIDVVVSDEHRFPVIRIVIFFGAVS